MIRARLSTPIVLLYWLMLVAGLSFYTAIRIDDVWAVLPLWVGAVGGTVLGQLLALRNFRLWVTIGLVVAVLSWSVPILPPELSSTELWMAFVPAALCGYFCLGDRAQLVAFWFPAVLWMLSILDGTSGQATPDGAGIVLLGALAVLFIVFLRLRESRRVALWRTVAATPLATAKPNAVLKEPPGRQFARGGWALLVSSITFGVTAWVAPYLWQTESFDAGQVEVANPEPAHGLACCPVHWDAEVTRSRVSEYFDIGRGHDELTGPPRKGIDCQVCEDPAIAATGAIVATGGVIIDGDPIGPGVVVSDDPALPAYPRTGFEDQGRATGHVGSWRSSTVTPVPSTITEPGAAPDIDPQVPQVAEVDSRSPAAPPVVEVPAPAPLIDPSPPSSPPSMPEPQVLVPPEPSAAPTPAPVPDVEPTPPLANVDHPRATATPSPAPAPTSSLRPHRSPAAGVGPNFLHWIAVLIAAALLFQLTGLGLRPLRRWITLRHLRRPFWDETIDQRVSNSWQLALVGLRDAGWRSTSSEAPREFAQRAGVEGLERCATILERARHGVAIDAGDLSEMATSADAAYRSARNTLGRVARTVAWIRWPLT